MFASIEQLTSVKLGLRTTSSHLNIRYGSNFGNLSQSIHDKKFDRKTVLELFGKILVGYGVEKLYGLLQDAARDLWEKLKKDPEEFMLREDANFYRHDQVDNTPVNSTLPTLTASRGYSVRSRTATSTQSRPSPSTQVSSSSAKRCRNRSEDGNPPQGTKRLRQ